MDSPDGIMVGIPGMKVLSVSPPPQRDLRFRLRSEAASEAASEEDEGGAGGGGSDAPPARFLACCALKFMMVWRA